MLSPSETTHPRVPTPSLFAGGQVCRCMSCLPVDVVCLPVDVRFAGGFQENGFQHTPSHENTSKKSRWMLKKSVMILHQKFNTHCQTDRKVYSPVDVGLPVDVGRFAGGCGRFAGGCHASYIHRKKKTGPPGPPGAVMVPPHEGPQPKNTIKQSYRKIPRKT